MSKYSAKVVKNIVSNDLIDQLQQDTDILILILILR